MLFLGKWGFGIVGKTIDSQFLGTETAGISLLHIDLVFPHHQI